MAKPCTDGKSNGLRKYANLPAFVHKPASSGHSEVSTEKKDAKEIEAGAISFRICLVFTKISGKNKL